ncbi:hypothetical protein ACFC0C_37670 [Streptomyces sp. NPDC056178]|uniref:hypothetical protein n=1 Tax=unclassified Streptomyces TaxID=2593676 RepID=UPI0035DFB1D6
MRVQHERAARALKMTCTGGEPFWGWDGRTLGRAGTTATGQRVWLRMTSAPTDKAHGKLWEGAETAQQAFADLGGHRPALLAIHDATGDGTAYRAELSDHLDQPVISGDPILRDRLELPDGWWPALEGALEKVAAATTDRVAVRQEYIDRAVPTFLGIPAPPVTHWSTVHGDLHWANLTAPELRLLDWEAWGQGPWGYDQATLYAYSLLRPGVADRVRDAFPFLGTTQTHAAEAVVCAELLQTVSRGTNLELAGPLHKWAEQLRDRTSAARPRTPRFP